MFNLSKALMSVGMEEKTSKSQASRLAKLANVTMEDYMISEEDFILATVKYEDAKNTSKYKDGIVKIRAAINKGGFTVPEEWKAPTITTKATSPFVKIKAVDRLIAEHPELKERLDAIMAEIEEENLAK